MCKTKNKKVSNVSEDKEEGEGMVGGVKESKSRDASSSSASNDFEFFLW